MRYFKDRQQAGKLLSEKLIAYRTKNCAVVCLSEGAVVVGAEIAQVLHASLFLLVTENVSLPSEPEPIAVMTSSGTYTPNNAYSTGELESLSAEFHGLIDQQRMLAFQKLNRISQESGEIPKQLLKNHIVVVVSDGLKNGLSLDVAVDFLKPVKITRLIIATPIASVDVVDKMHLQTDEICCLDVLGDYINTDHYYENNDLPSHESMIKSIENMTLNWQHVTKTNI